MEPYVQNRTLDLSAQSGDPWALLRQSGQAAQGVSNSAQNVDPQALMLGVMNLLRSQQSGYQGQEFAARGAQAQRGLSGLPQSLIGANPAIQNSYINANKGALDPTIQGAQDAQQTIGNQLGQIKDTLQLYETSQQKAADDARQAVLNTAATGGAMSLQGLMQANPKIFKTAGLDAETLIAGAKAKEAATKKGNTQVVQLADGRDVLIDTNTGQIIKTIGGGTSTGVSPALANSPYAGALSTILGSGKFTALQTKQITNSINQGEEPVAVIKNQAKQIMTGANQTKVESYEIAKGSIQEIDSALKQFYAAGGSTSLLNGTMEKVINKLGNVNNPQLVDLATQIQSSLQVYRNAVSGTAYSVQEGADIASIFPGIKKSQGLNQAIIKGRLKAFDSTIDSAYRTVLGDSYDKLNVPSLAPSKSGGTSQMIKMTGPKGTFNVPADKVEVFRQNGYK